MTLRRKLMLKIAAQLLGVVIITGIGLWSLANLQTALGQTTDQFGAMRTVHQIGHHLTMARTLASQEHPDLDAAHSQLASAAQLLEIGQASVTSDQLVRDSASVPRLIHLVHKASLETNPTTLAAHATTGIASVQRWTERIQSDVRQRRQAAVAINTQAVRNLSLAGLLIVLASAIVGIFQYRSIVRPIASLRRGVDRLHRRDFSTPVQCLGDREFLVIAQRFNEMSREIQHAQQTLEERVEERTTQLIRSERLARLGVLAAGFAHEINNPLAIISGHAQLALRHWDRDSSAKTLDDTSCEMADALRVALDEVDRSKRIVDRLQSLGASEQIEKAPVSLHDVLTMAIGLVEPIAQQAHCAIDYHLDGESTQASTMGNQSELVQVAINLLLNAINAAHNGGTVRVTCSQGLQGVSIQITDDGVGMTHDELACIFDPFVTGTGSTGLGLAVCQAIVDRHGARIAARSDGPGTGSVFTIHFAPCASEVAA